MNLVKMGEMNGCGVREWELLLTSENSNTADEHEAGRVDER